MERIPQELRDALDELGRVGKDPNHTTEQVKKATRRVHVERERAMEESSEYAEMLRRNAEAWKRETRSQTPSRGTDLPSSAVLRHGRSWLPPRRPDK